MRTVLPFALLTLLLSILSHLGVAADASSVPSLDDLKRGSPVSVSLSSDPVAADHALIAALEPAHDPLHLHGASPVVGVILLGLSIIPLFFGWRFLRVAITLLMGYFLALLTWEYGMPPLHQLLPGYTTATLVPILIGVTVVAGLIGCLLGWFLYKLEVALAGALLGAMVLAIPAMYFNQPVIVWSLLAVGLVVGFIAGWVIAPYWAALQTSILGGMLVAQGFATLSPQVMDDSPVRYVSYAIAISAAIIGFVVQVLWIGRRQGHPLAHAHRAALSS